MTNPTELLPCIYVRFADNGEIRKWDRKPFDGATEYHAAVSGLLPMATAPKDRTVILGVMRDDLPETDGGFSPHRWSGRIVPIRHEGETVSGYDLGWSVALPVGHGGLPDDWFVGWVPVATALSAAPAPVASVEVERVAAKEATLILRALRTRMATACDWTKAGKDHVKVRTADWHVLMELGERAKAFLATESAEPIMSGWQHHSGVDYHVVMSPVETTDDPSIRVSGDTWKDGDDLARIVADALNRYAALSAAPASAPDTEQLVKHMTQRFLAWRLPGDFNPDDGISFDPMVNVGTEWERRRQPIGTNLLNAVQAEAMARHMLEGAALSLTTPARAVSREEVVNTLAAVKQAWDDEPIFSKLDRREIDDLVEAVIGLVSRGTYTTGVDVHETGVGVTQRPDREAIARIIAPESFERQAQDMRDFERWEAKAADFEANANPALYPEGKAAIAHIVQQWRVMGNGYRDRAPRWISHALAKADAIIALIGGE